MLCSRGWGSPVVSSVLLPLDITAAWRGHPYHAKWGHKGYVDLHLSVRDTESWLEQGSKLTGSICTRVCLVSFMSNSEGSNGSQNMLSRLMGLPLAMTFPHGSPCLFHFRVEMFCGRVWDFLYQCIALQYLPQPCSDLDVGSSRRDHNRQPRRSKAGRF